MKRFFFALKERAVYGIRLCLFFAAGGNACTVCGDKAGVIPLCGECEKRCFAEPPCGEGERCSVCGKTLISERGVCMRCRRERLLAHTDAVFPLYSYRLWNSVLLFRWKIQGCRALSPFFAARTASALKTLPEACVVVPVPPRPGKIRKKGWDQIEELCRFLEYRYGYDVCRILERRTTGEQKKLGRGARLESLGKTYALKSEKALKRELKRFGGEVPKNVCIVDDLFTTGVTLESCAAVLKSAGAEKVFAVTLFIAD